MKIIFFGSDDFSAFHLKALLASEHQVLGVVTSQDKPQGRGMKVGLSCVKKFALEYALPCLQASSLKSKEIVDALRAYDADIFVVVAYGSLLTQQVLDIPKIFCINIHPSCLPKYRGPAPIHWAVLNGEKETGVTIQKMALSLDSGDIIIQKTMTIGDDEDTPSLRRRMMSVGSELLLKVLDMAQKGRIVLTPQEESKATYAPKLTRQMGQIDWNKSALVILNQIRGLKPWPGAYTFYKGKMLKIIQAALTTDEVSPSATGQIQAIGKNGFVVATKDKGILITEVQPQDGRVMPAASFMAGYKLTVGCGLG